jgi:hypothetical protein
VITEKGNELRPHDLPDAETVYYFDLQMREKGSVLRLRKAQEVI